MESKTTRDIKINALLNTIKQFCTVLFPLITVPYVTRILQTDNYGKVNFTFSIVNYFTLLAALGINNYAIREGSRIRSDKNKLSQFASQVFTINLLSTLITYGIIVIVLLFSVKLRDYRLLIIIQSLSILFITIGADWINSIYEDYYYITIRYIIVQLVSLVLLFIFVKKPDDYVKYILINVFAVSGGNIFNIFYIRRYAHLRVLRQLDIRKHLSPMLQLFFISIAQIIYVNSDITILGLLRTESEVGLYSLAVKIYTVIKTLLNATSAVAMPRLSGYLGENKNKEYKELYNKIFNLSFSILMPSIVGLVVLSKNIVLIVSGNEFYSSYVPLIILSITLLFSVFISLFSSCVLIPKKGEKYCLYATCIGAVINLMLNFILIPRIGMNAAAGTTLVSEFTVCLIYYFVAKKRYHETVKIKNILSVALGCLIIVIVFILVHFVVNEIYVETIITILLSSILYLTIQVRMKNESVSEVWSLIIQILQKMSKRNKENI